jgi:hypothetical protein
VKGFGVSYVAQRIGGLGGWNWLKIRSNDGVETSGFIP